MPDPNDRKATPEFSAAVLRAALDHLLKLSNHYAELLNMHDGGERKTFASVEAWVGRLIETKDLDPKLLERSPSEHLFVNGIVAARDKKPYVQIATEHGMVVQLDIADTRKVAADMQQSAARVEADALLLRFAKKLDSSSRGDQIGGEMMMLFRDFRAELDEE